MFTIIPKLDYLYLKEYKLIKENIKNLHQKKDNLK